MCVREIYPLLNLIVVETFRIIVNDMVIGGYQKLDKGIIDKIEPIIIEIGEQIDINNGIISILVNHKSKYLCSLKKCYDSNFTNARDFPSG